MAIEAEVDVIGDAQSALEVSTHFTVSPSAKELFEYVSLPLPTLTLFNFH